ncbi:MAG: nitroreductase family protein [Oscillospiraceae bacterium]|nr:nitroreductase family protein [Oscillospiraceae bacterium]
MKNSVVEVIMSRRSVRKYKQEQVEEMLLSTIIEAGRFAPSGGDAQLTHIIAIQNPDILRDIIRISKSEFAKMPITDNMYDSLRSTIEHALMPEFDFDYIYGAPTLIIIANKKACTNAMADSICVLQNILIAAEALGVGACYQNAPHWLDDSEGFRKYMYTLGLGKDETIAGAVSLGYSAEEPRPPLPRKGNFVTYVR